MTKAARVRQKQPDITVDIKATPHCYGVLVAVFEWSLA